MKIDGEKKLYSVLSFCVKMVSLNPRTVKNKEDVGTVMNLDNWQEIALEHAMNVEKHLVVIVT